MWIYLFKVIALELKENIIICDEFFFYTCVRCSNISVCQNTIGGLIKSILKYTFDKPVFCPLQNSVSALFVNLDACDIRASWNDYFMRFLFETRNRVFSIGIHPKVHSIVKNVPKTCVFRNFSYDRYDKVNLN